MTHVMTLVIRQTRIVANGVYVGGQGPPPDQACPLLLPAKLSMHSNVEPKNHKYERLEMQDERAIQAPERPPRLYMRKSNSLPRLSHHRIEAGLSPKLE